MHLVHRKTCRVCGSTALARVIDVGEQFLQGSFVKPGKPEPPRRRIPLVLLRCDPTADETACGLLQLSHSVPPAILYANYWYRSGTNRTMTDHLRNIAEEAHSMIGKKQEALVLDIGCNDGTLLSFYPPSCDRYGIDPSDISRGVGEGITIINDLFPSVELKKKLNGRQAEVITSIAMFYDLEDPVEFARRVKELLAPNGLWIFEMSYMPAMLEMNSYDTICHEHLEYYSLSVLETIVARAGMKIVRVSLNDINGGSLRCYATHKDTFAWDRSSYAKELMALRSREFDLQLDTDIPYRKFQERIEAHREELGSLLKKLRRSGKSIHIYGASTKGNTILQYCGIDNSIIDFAAERNPEKYGAKTLGTDIPIVSEEESRGMKPDYYLVLPWHFRKEILEREQQTLESGVGMIFPLPKVEIVTGRG